MINSDEHDGNCMGRVAMHNDEENDDSAAFPNIGGDIPPEGTALMTSSKYDLFYRMNQQRRGIAYIFNHKKFKDCPERHGTDVDCKKLNNCFRNLKFDVLRFNDLKVSEIEQQISMAVDTDHTKHDCLVVIVLTHGDHDVLNAADKMYSPQQVLFDKFTADNCPSLAGKPKFFFIQACQGGGLDSGITLVDINSRRVRTEMDGVRPPYRIPTKADFLIMYATSRGQYAFCNRVEGSYFITALCEELESRARYDNLLVILTIVIQRVAIDFVSLNTDEPEYNDRKQIPFFQSALTRLVQFPKLDTI
ncbi:hypothetical protein JTB14_005917 [Gonioctena quinquepunctata]|nr:hypothetical protein JTB14_005917 [Gonioctena quinquepunctata]